MGGSPARSDFKVCLADRSLGYQRSHTELAGNSIKAWDRKLAAASEREGGNGCSPGPGARSGLSTSPFTLETELWEREASSWPHSSSNHWKHAADRC